MKTKRTSQRTGLNRWSNNDNNCLLPNIYVASLCKRKGIQQCLFFCLINWFIIGKFSSHFIWHTKGMFGLDYIWEKKNPRIKVVLKKVAMFGKLIKVTLKKGFFMVKGFEVCAWKLSAYFFCLTFLFPILSPTIDYFKYKTTTTNNFILVILL